MVRYKKIVSTYHPFIFIIIAAFFSELTGLISERLYKTNAVPANIYSLVECLLWLWQFRRWGGGFKKKWMSVVLVIAMISFWSIETFIQGVTNFNSAFSIFYSFILIFLAINQVNKLIVEEKNNLLKNSKFLICAGILLFYSYNILVGSFYVLNMKESDTFLANVYYILMYVNLFVNLLFALATLWIPTRQRFTLQS